MCSAPSLVPNIYGRGDHTYVPPTPQGHVCRPQWLRTGRHKGPRSAGRCVVQGPACKLPLAPAQTGHAVVLTLGPGGARSSAPATGRGSLL